MFNDIVNYWNNFKNANDITEPIYKWQCFNRGNNTVSTLTRFIEEIGDILSSVSYSEFEINDYKSKWRFEQAGNIFQSPQRKAFSCLFLIRCALISRLERDWDLIIRNEFFNDIGNTNFDRTTDWKCCITTAERELCRTPLVQQYSATTIPRKYCARVLVEAGIPLRSLDQSTNVVYGLKNICKLYFSTLNENAYENSIKDFMLYGNFTSPTGQSFWLPGGIAGCRSFFSIGLELITDTIQSLNDDNDIQSVLRSYGFIDTSDSAISDIFGTKFIHREKRALSIKRFLHWEDAQTSTGIYIKYKPSINLPNTNQITLKIAGEEINSWTYASNGVLNGESQEDYYVDNPFGVAKLLKEDNSSTTEKEVLSEISLNDPVFFKHSSDPNSGGDFEWSSTSSFKQTDFPICVIFPEGYIEEHSLNLSNIEISKLDIESSSNSFYVYRFETEQQLNKAGLSVTDSKLVPTPPQQPFTITFIDCEGRRFPNCKTSTEYPHASLRCLNAQILTRKINDSLNSWHSISSDICDDLFSMAYYKLDSTAKTDPGSRFLILPRGFRYVFEKNEDKTRVTGLKFYFKNDDDNLQLINNTTIYIDGKEDPKPTDWANLQHNSIIRCDIKNSRNEKISLTIPSPAVGISWFTDSNDETNKICANSYKDLKINCVPNANSGSFEILYEIKLIDKGQEILKLSKSTKPIIPDKDSEIRPPSFVTKLFSATNSLSAQITISAQITRNSIPESNPDSHTQELTITRFDESEYNGRFFCVGILSQEVLDPDIYPTEEQMQSELWMKVPAVFSSDGNERKWNKRNRIRLVNYSISNTSNLSTFQKLLLGNDVELAQKLIRNYFNKNCNNLNNDVIELIRRSFDICVNYDIPICNLWVLQATIQNDLIFVQIPDIIKYKHLLNENTYLCSFDWQLIRPKSLFLIKNENTKEQIKKICYNATHSSGVTNIWHQWDIDTKEIKEPPIIENDDGEAPPVWYSESIKKEYEIEMHTSNFSNYELLLYFIIKYIVYGTEENYNIYYEWALLCLKYLKIQNAYSVSTSLIRIRQQISSSYKTNQFREGFNNIVWIEWKAGKFKAPDVINYSEDPFKQGQDAAKTKFRERFWLESLKKIFGNAYNFKLYGFHFPSELSSQNLFSGKVFLQQAEEKLNELEQKFKQYKHYYQQGWESLGDNEPVEYRVYIPFLIATDINNDFYEKARCIGEVIHKWFKNWPPKVDGFSVGTMLKEFLKDLTPLPFFDLQINNLERSNKLNKYLDIIPQNLGGLIKNVQPAPNNLDDCINNLSGDSKKKLLNMLHNGFGIWQQEYINRWPTDNKIFRPTRYQDFLEKARKLSEQGQDENAEVAYENAASLNINAYTENGKRMFQEGSKSIESFRREYNLLQKKYGVIHFKSNLSEFFKKGVNKLKEAIYTYRSAARLGNNLAALYYYLRTDELYNDLNILDVFDIVNSLICGDYENNYDKIKIRIDRDESIFRKWRNIGNEWVYLRKAALAGISEAKKEWEYYEEDYIAEYTDPRDNNKYTIVKIDNKWWLAEDLKYRSPKVMCHKDQYYYNHQSIKDAVMEGWQLPSREDFENLNKWCAKHSIQKNPGGVSLKSKDWKPDEAIKGIFKGTDDFGFNAKHSGMMIAGLDKVLRGDEAFYWTSSEMDAQNAYCASLSTSHNELNITSMSKDYCLALRLVCNDLPDSNSSDDEDIY